MNPIEMKDVNKKLRVIDIIHTIAIIGFTLSMISFFLSFATNAQGMFFLFLLVSFIFFSIGYGMQKVKEKVEINFKRKHLSRIINETVPNMKYDEDDGLRYKEIKGAALFPLFDSYIIDDFIKGTYKGVQFRSSDIKLIENVKTKNSTKEVSIFKGRLYIFDFNKKFRYNLALVQHKDLWNDTRKGNVKTESLEFNQSFRIFSEMEQEAFYILTPHLMEKLTYLDKKHHDSILFSFNENKMYIALYDKDSIFELKKYETIEQFIERIKHNVLDACEIVDILNLDFTIFFG